MPSTDDIELDLEDDNEADETAGNADEIDEGSADDEAAEAEGADSEGSEAPDDEELTVEIEGEASADPGEKEPAPAWVKKLREDNRKQARRIKELETTHAAEPVKVEALPPKPTLEGSEYDSEKFATALEGWMEKKRAVDAKQAELAGAETKRQEAWQAKISVYNADKAKLKVRDYKIAEDQVLDLFDANRQAMILDGAENPALLIYAIGSNPALAQRLAEIDNPVKFAFAVARVETKLKVGKRKAETVPERKIGGGGRVNAGGSDATLERLRSEAARTGDDSKVLAYRAKLRRMK